MFTCKQLIEEFLADYVEEALPQATRTELERHLAVCPPCVAYLATYRRTRDVVAGAAAAAMPEEMGRVLRRLLGEKLRLQNP